MKAHFFLPSVDGDLTEGKPPINVKFEIPYFTTSGIQVRSIWIENDISNNIHKGEISKDHRKVRIPSSAMGQIHHSEWRLSTQNSVK